MVRPNAAFQLARLFAIRCKSVKEKGVLQTPEEVIKFYTQAMTDRGWETAMSMVQNGKGACMFKKQGKQLIVNAQKRGQKIKVTMGPMSK